MGIIVFQVKMIYSYTGTGVFKKFFLFVYHGKRVIVEVLRGFHLFTFIQYLVIHVHFVVGHFDGH